jgi:hypothetical protein
MASLIAGWMCDSSRTLRVMVFLWCHQQPPPPHVTRSTDKSSEHREDHGHDKCNDDSGMDTCGLSVLIGR